MVLLKNCPLCDQPLKEVFITCKDYTSSHQSFTLQKCTACSFLLTNPRPERNDLPNYYKSPAYISHTDKSSGILDKIYLLARKITMRWKINVITTEKNTGSILDYGCGTGEFLSYCSNAGWKIAGLEPSPEARTKANQKTGTNIAGNLTDFIPKQFDVITLWHVLEHVVDLKQTLSELGTLLKDDGMIFIAVPNHESHDAEYYHAHWAAYDVPRHLWHFSKTTMQSLLSASGLKLKTIKPMKLDAYYVSLLSEKYKASNQTHLKGIIAGIYRGWISNIHAKRTMNYSSLIYLVTK